MAQAGQYLIRVLAILVWMGWTVSHDYSKDHRNYVNGTGRVVPEKGPGYLGVIETVSYDYSTGHLNYIDGTGWVVPEKSPGYLGVDETVSHDQDMKQALPQAAPILNIKVIFGANKLDKEEDILSQYIVRA